VKRTIPKLPLSRETIRNLVNRELAEVAGGVKPSLNGTSSITYPSDAGGCESGNWSCAGVSCC
jgi:hypothetical protein